MSDIKLRLVNRSSDNNNSKYAIFQENLVPDAHTQNIAWRVVENLGRGNFHEFKFPMEFEVAARDSYGNHTPPLSARNSRDYEVFMETSGHVLRVKEIASRTNNQIELQNNLDVGAIDAEIFRDGKLLATKLNVVPKSQANFEFQPIIFIGAVSQVEEGEVMNSNVTDQDFKKLELFGVASADIVISGGGMGEHAQPYQFHLENVRHR